MTRVLPVLVATMAVVLPAAATVTSSVSCNQYIAEISHLGGTIEARLTITFDNPTVNIGLDSLIVTSEIVNPASSSLKARLPAGFFVPARFPVLITVQPGSIPTSSITFLGGYTVDIVTDNIEFEDRTPFRLLRAPDGGAFEDITRTLGLGSYRVRGGGGAFSEFLIAADLRPQRRVIQGKFVDYDTLLATHGPAFEPPSLEDTLRNQLDLAWAAFVGGDLHLAIDEIDALIDLIEAESGSGIPNQYADGMESIAGILHGAAESLRLALVLGGRRAVPQTSTITRNLTTTNGHRLKVTLSFEQVHAIELDGITITAQDVDPANPLLLARLPSGVSIPDELPVLVSIDAGPVEEQAFRGRVLVDIETDELAFLGNTPLRLFRAATPVSFFRDVSFTMGVGSYRVRGGGGAFSQYIIGEDQRSTDVVINGKFERLEADLAAYQSAIDTAVYSSLVTDLDIARNQFDLGLYADSIAAIDSFLGTVDDAAGDGIPDTWHYSDGRVNVAAMLSAEGESLRLSLSIGRAESNSSFADPADANRDGTVDILDVFYVINRVFSSG